MKRYDSSYTLGGLIAIALWSGSLLTQTEVAQAKTPLTQGMLQAIQNSVQLIVPDQAARPAQVRDRMVPGDALSTDRQSLAEIRFNEGSLARIGERTVFQFVPRTRIFRLSNGTALLLIPPGRGETRVRTPNAVVGIRGSALFVRYLPESDTTVVGALTNSGIQVFNRDYSEYQSLPAGQVTVIVKDQITQIYTFDLKTFYDTSELVDGLQLSDPDVKNGDRELQTVREETVAALKHQQAQVAPTAGLTPARLMELSEVLSISTGQILGLTGVTPEIRNSRPIQDSQPQVEAPGAVNLDSLLQPPRSTSLPPPLAITPGLPGPLPDQSEN